jgi:hypothetical protein
MPALLDAFGASGIIGIGSGEQPAKPKVDWRRLPIEVLQSDDEGKSLAFRATAVAVDLGRNVVAVKSCWGVKVGDRWNIAWETRISEDGSAVDEPRETAIENDPQIKQTISLIKGIDGAPASLKRAIRVGAAAMRASERVTAEYAAYLDGLTKRVELAASPFVD